MTTWVLGDKPNSGGPWSHGDDMCDQGRGRAIQPRPETGANPVRTVPTLPHPYYRQEKDTGQLTNLTVSRSLAKWRDLIIFRGHVLYTGQADRLFGGD
jgi:hypothetical protein